MIANVLLNNQEVNIMVTKEVKPISSNANVGQAPQLRVRSHLRGGASIDACEKALEDWKRSYYKWYEVVKYKNV